MSRMKITIAAMLLSLVTSVFANCNLPNNSTFSITISPENGDFQCGETVSVSVDTGGNACTKQWTLVNNGGQVIETAEITDDTAQSTDITLYWFNVNEANTCTWKLKCVGTTSINSCEDEVEYTVTLPDTGGEVLLECDPDIETREGYGKYWVSHATASAYPIEYNIYVLDTCIFYDKVKAHEDKHLEDANDSEYVSTIVSDSRYWMRLDDVGLTSPLDSRATSYFALYFQAQAVAAVMMRDLANDMETRAYPISDAIAPLLFYQSNSESGI